MVTERWWIRANDEAEYEAVRHRTETIVEMQNEAMRTADLIFSSWQDKDTTIIQAREFLILFARNDRLAAAVYDAGEDLRVSVEPILDMAEKYFEDKSS